MTRTSNPLTVSSCLFFLVLLLQVGYVSADEPSRCELRVTIDLKGHSISGEGKIIPAKKSEGYIHPGSLKISDLKVGERVFDDDARAQSSIIRVGEGEVVEFTFQGKFGPGKERSNIENVGVTDQNVIGPEGVMLLSGWYPSFSGLCVYELEATIPEELVALSESDFSTYVSGPDRGMKTQTFSFPVPVPGITLVAGKYTVREQEYRGISIRTLFFPRHEHLSQIYMRNMKRYIDLYEGMLGSYPFKTFTVVENFFQTGYSFPTYTLLGSRIIPFSYVPEISLGHEFLHQWFGHFVDVDRRQGNWSEGLTTYLADHWFKELSGKGYEYRKKAIIDFMQYVSPMQDVPVSEFRSRLDFATKAIGYGKSAMIFHMARKMVGDSAFFAGLREFIGDNGLQKAGWKELQNSFSLTGEIDFERFFDVWTGETGMADIDISRPTIRTEGNKYVLIFRIVQKNGPFPFSLPLKVETEESTEKFHVTIDGRTTKFKKTFDARPVRVIVDDEYDTFRRLIDAEIPPVISGFTGNKNSVVIISDADRQNLKDVERFFEIQGYRVSGEDVLRDGRVPSSPILYMSSDRRALQRVGNFPDDVKSAERGSVVKAVKNLGNRDNVVVMIHYDDPEQLRNSYRKIFRYGNYSLLVFEKGENILKKTEPAARGIVLELQ